MGRLRNILIVMLLASPMLGYCQPDKVARAVAFIQAGEIDQARASIDSAMQDPETAKEHEALYVKGYIYKELHKKYEASLKGTNFRNQAIECFVKSIQADTSNQNVENNKQNLRAIAGSFYNDAVTLLDTVSYARSIDFFELYKKTAKIADPSVNLDKRDIEFKLAVATQYDKIYKTNPKKQQALFEKMRELYLEVLIIDSNNLRAYYNVGIMFYNQAVNIINEMDYDVDIFTLSSTQDNTVTLFRQSLPYMLSAYKLDPGRKETLIALSGIYFSLNDEENFKKFKALAEAIDSDKK